MGPPSYSGPSSVDTAPLVVDIDGTLVRSDLLKEGLVRLALLKPWMLPQAALALLRGRAHLKEFVARTSGVDLETMPLEPAVLGCIVDARERSVPVVLASAADQSQVDFLAQRVGAGLALGSKPSLNLRGEAKLAEIQRICPVFDYIGNDRDDIVIWQHARRALAVAPSPAVERGAQRANTRLEIIAPRASRFAAFVRAIRPHQWAKNALIVLPALAAHAPLNLATLSLMAVAFASFSAVASSVYLVNDLVDLPNDRVHARKRNRPLAAGTLPVDVALLGSVFLLVLGCVAAFLTNLKLGVALCAYFVMTTAYSFALKRKILVDVIVLALLYTSRVVAGGIAASVPLSRWFLALSMFLFLSLAVAKRVIELRGSSSDSRLPGRGYRAADLQAMISLGMSAVCGTALVYALYVTGSEVSSLYRRPDLLWAGLPLLIYWQARAVLLAARGTLHDDPVVFALRDRTSYMVGIAFMTAVWLAA